MGCPICSSTSSCMPPTMTTRKFCIERVIRVRTASDLYTTRSRGVDRGGAGKKTCMNEDRSSERTETDERVAENKTPSERVPVTRKPGDTDPATGLPPGMHDDDRSPLDPGGPLDPTRDLDK